MPIYSIREDSERFRNIDYRAGNRATHTPKTTVPVSRDDEDAYNNKNKENRDDRQKQSAYASGNMFESLAKTNPELFNTTKLEELKHSENLVKDFNEYMASVYGKDIDRFGRFVDAMETEFDYDKVHNSFQMRFNISLHGALYSRYKELMDKHKLSEEEVAKIVTQEFFPESLSEQAIRDCINTRIANNRCLTDSLTKMLKQNFRLFGLSKAEAKSLIDDLNDDNKNHEATAKIRDFLQNPKLLKKFKLGDHNYDFRSIGGGVLFLSKNDDIQFCEHPSKNLSLIFKYDAIINAHGTGTPDEYGDITDTAAYTAKRIKESTVLVEELRTYIGKLVDEVCNYDKYAKHTETIVNLKQIYIALRKVNSIPDTELYNLMQKARSSFVSLHQKYRFTDAGSKRIKEKTGICYKLWQSIHARKDPKQAMKDGQSANWIMEPISTLSQSDLTRAIDIVRALKKEGFKKVFIGSCNPGGFTLPKDITQDKEFKVYYGTSSVLKEFFGDSMDSLLKLEKYIDHCLAEERSPYEFYTLNELYQEYDLLVSSYPINEGVIDKLKEFFKKAAQIIMEIWKRVIDFLKKIALKIIELVKSTFGTNSNKKIKKPIDVSTIRMDGDKAVLVTTRCNTPEEVKNEVEKSNQSIQYAIQKHAKREIEYVKRYDDILKRNKNYKNKMQESYGFFEQLILI